MLGIAVILSGGWSGERLDVIGCALLGPASMPASCSQFSKSSAVPSPPWLTSAESGDFLGGALVLFPAAAHFGLPTPGRLAWLFLIQRKSRSDTILVDDPRIANDQPVEASMLSSWSRS